MYYFDTSFLAPLIHHQEILAVNQKNLTDGKLIDHSRSEYRRIIQWLVDDGAQGVILGCTEISMLIGSQDSPVPVFDTTSIHARSAADLALCDDRVLPTLG